MPYDEHLADRVRQTFSRKKVASQEKKMMGGLVFMVDGKMCLGVDFDRQTGEDRLMCRIGKDQYPEALQQKGCREMDFTGKPMKGFVFVYSEGIDADADLEYWVNMCLEYNKVARASKKVK